MIAQNKKEEKYKYKYNKLSSIKKKRFNADRSEEGTNNERFDNDHSILIVQKKKKKEKQKPTNVFTTFISNNETSTTFCQHSPKENKQREENKEGTTEDILATFIQKNKEKQ